MYNQTARNSSSLQGKNGYSTMGQPSYVFCCGNSRYLAVICKIRKCAEINILGITIEYICTYSFERSLNDGKFFLLN